MNLGLASEISRLLLNIVLLWQEQSEKTELLVWTFIKESHLKQCWTPSPPTHPPLFKQCSEKTLSFTFQLWLKPTQCWSSLSSSDFRGLRRLLPHILVNPTLLYPAENPDTIYFATLSRENRTCRKAQIAKRPLLRLFSKTSTLSTIWEDVKIRPQSLSEEQ